MGIGKQIRLLLIKTSENPLIAWTFVVVGVLGLIGTALVLIMSAGEALPGISNDTATPVAASPWSRWGAAIAFVVFLSNVIWGVMGNILHSKWEAHKAKQAFDDPVGFFRNHHAADAIGQAMMMTLKSASRAKAHQPDFIPHAADRDVIRLLADRALNVYRTNVIRLGNRLTEEMPPIFRLDTMSRVLADGNADHVHQDEWMDLLRYLNDGNRLTFAGTDTLVRLMRTFRARFAAAVDEVWKLGDANNDPAAKALDLQADRHRDARIHVRFDDLERLIGERVQARFDSMSAPDSGPGGGVKPRLSAPANFVGREGELAKAKAALDKAQGTGAVLITGLHGQGGIGKTALALRIAADAAALYPDGQMIIDLRGSGTLPMSLREAMQTLIAKLHPGIQQFPDEDDDLAAMYQQAFGDRKVLVLLDNAHDDAQVRPLLPPAPSGAIVTSRHYISIDGVDPIRLDVLTIPDAIALARSIAHCLSESDAAQLAQACGYFALAVKVAANAIANNPTIPAARHIARLTDNVFNYLDTAKPTDPDGLPFVRRAFETSLEQLSPELQTFWATLSAFPDEFELLAASVIGASDPLAIEVTEQFLSDLFNAGLLEHADGRYWMHDLAREYARTRKLDAPGRLDAGRRHASFYYDLLSRADDTYLAGKPLEALAVVDEEMPNIVAAQAWAATHWKVDEKAARLASRCFDHGAYVLNLRLPPQTQAEWLELSVEACRHLQDGKLEANALGNLGLIAQTRGDLDAAEKFHRESLEIHRKLGRLDGQAANLGNLGLITRMRGDLDAAEKLHHESLEIDRKLGRLEGQADQLNNLGLIAQTRGDRDAAEKFHRESLEINRKLGRLVGQANNLGNLGGIAQACGDLEAAEKLVRESLEIERKLGRLEGQANDLGNLGLIAKRRSDLAEARRLWTESRGLFARIGMPHMVKKVQGMLDRLPED